MKRKVLISLMTVAAAMTASAAVISPHEALQRATGNMSLAPGLNTSASPTLVATCNAQDGQAAYYVFDQAAANAGYMVLSADDQAMPVLGYSLQGRYDPKNENLAYWLSQYARQIEAARAGEFTTPKYASNNRPYRAPVLPLTATTWGQDTPYNNLCPEEKNERTPTGCVATAMSQVMKYHNWPAQGIGTHSYTWQGQELSFDYGATNFDWTSMLNSYASGYNDAQAAAVSTLMYAAGVSVNMTYNVYGSGTQSNKVPPALISNFGYDPACDIYPREYYGLLEWEQMIYDNLVNVGPVYYGGQGDGGGHAYVCDGYDRDGYFHFNWGWDGLSDGDYLLWALDPMAQGTGGSSVTGQGFNDGQQIVLGIQPPRADAQPAAARLGFKSPMEVAINKRGSISAYVVTAQPVNTSSHASSYILGIRLQSDSLNVDTVIPTKSSDFNLNPGSYVTMPTSYFFDLTDSLAAGMYTVTPMYSLYDAQLPDSVERPAPVWHPVEIRVGNQPTSLLKVNKSKSQIFGQTIINTSFEASIPTTGLIDIQDVELTTTLYPGNPFGIRAKAVNDSGVEQYLGMRVVIATHNGTRYQIVAYSNLYTVDVLDGEELPFSFFTQMMQGTIDYDTDYYVYFVNQNDQTVPLSEPLLVHTPANAGAIQVDVTPFNIKGEATTVNPADCQLSGTLNCSTGYFAKAVYLVMYDDATGAKFNDYYDAGYLFADPGQSVPFTSKVVLPEMPQNKDYYVGLGYVKLGTFIRISDIKTIRFGVYDGIDDLSADAPRHETARYNAYGQRLSAPAPGVNIIRYSDGTVSKEVVK